MNANVGVEEHRDAGEFATWLTMILATLRNGAASDVPCGDCTACCRASHFVHVEPGDVEARRVIPAELLFHAPGLPDDHMILGYDQHGACPLLTASGCSIYDARPRTCRTYDCRIFAASGVLPTEPTKAGIAATAATWQFSYANDGARQAHDAVRRASEYLAARRGAEQDATGLAIAALLSYDLFLAPPANDAELDAAVTQRLQVL